MWQQYGHLDAASPAAFHRRRLIIELCKRHAGRVTRILDAGCGRGELVGELARAYPEAELSASDVSLESLQATQRRHPNLELTQMDLARADFDSAHGKWFGRFELVTCSEVIEHLAADVQAVQRVARLLGTGGTLVVSVPGGAMSRFDHVIGHQRHYTSSALRELAAAAELEVLELMAWGFPFQNLYRSAVRWASRWSMPNPSEPRVAPPNGGVTRVLGVTYSALGRALKPLFYLNRSYWGEQMLVVLRKP